MKIKFLVRRSVLICLLAALFGMVPAPSSTRAEPSEKYYFDMVVDDAHGRLFATYHASDLIEVISTDTLQVLFTLNLGSVPRGMDISPDGKELAVALMGPGEIAFVDLDSLAVTGRVSPVGWSGYNRPNDVIYGRPGRVYSVGAPNSFGFDYVHVFDTLTKKELGRSQEIVRDDSRLAISADGGSLYTVEPGGWDWVTRFDVSTDTPAKIAFEYLTIKAWMVCVTVDGKVITTSGQVWSADLSQMLAKLPVYSYQVECNPALNQVYFSSGSSLVAYDTQSYAKVLEIPFPGSVRLACLSRDGSALYIATDYGIYAWRTNPGQRVFLPVLSRDYCPDFSDSFDRPDSGWIVEDNDYARTEYVNGEYRILGKWEGYLYLYGAPTCLRYAYHVQTDVHWAGAHGSSYGLLFGISPYSDRFYLFEMNSDYRLFQVVRFDGDEITVIVQPTWSGAIRSGEQSNQLSVSVQGSKAVVAINGTKVFQMGDLTIHAPSGVGLASSSYMDQNLSDAHFERFSVTSLDPVIPIVSESLIPCQSAALCSPPAELRRAVPWKDGLRLP